MAKIERLDNLMNARMTRRKLFMSAGVAGLGVALGSGLSLGNGTLGQGPLLRQVGLMHAVAQEEESIQEIINIAITAEALAITLLGGALASAEAGDYDAELPEVVLDILRTARAEEHFHYEYLMQAGAMPLTTTFTIPDPALLTSTETLFTTLVSLETAFVAAYMEAAQRFAELNQIELVKVAYQVAGVEAEHRVLANYALGVRPANNYGFYPALFTSVGGAATLLTDLGFIGGDGAEVMYPGPGEIDASMVENTEPDGPVVTCVVAPVDPVDPMPGCEFFEQTGHNVCGEFLEFWKTNGGLDVFGYPLTDAFEEENFDTGEVYLTQYFERQRYELHSENPEPYNVLLGRMGVQILVLQGRDWHDFPTADESQPHYFAETKHAIAPEFWEYWSSHGLNYGDSGVSFRESLLLFGYPISEPAMETNVDGDNVLTQWFERAVCEFHPNNEPEFQVLLRRLGAELLELR